MAANHYKLDNLTIIIDNNGLQIDGSNDEVMSLGDLPAKLRAFGFDFYEIDGHDLDAIEAAVTASHDRAFDPMDLSTDPAIDSGGIQKLRSGPRDESHLYDPVTILTLQRVVRTGRYDLFKAYSAGRRLEPQAHPPGAHGI